MCEDLLGQNAHPVEDMNLLKQGAAPITGLLQTMIGARQLHKRDASTDGHGGSPRRVLGAPDEQRGLLRLTDGAHNGRILK